MAERAADIPWSGTFPDKTYKVEVVLVTYLIGTHRKTPLRHRKADVKRAVRVAGTADKLGVAPQVFDSKNTPADRAFTQVHLFCCPATDILTDYGLIGLKLVKCTVQHLPGFQDHIFTCPFCLLDLLHVRFNRLGHIGFCDHIGMLL